VSSNAIALHLRPLSRPAATLPDLTHLWVFYFIYCNWC